MSAPATAYYGARPWHLKLWYGMDASAWLRLLWRNRFAVDVARVPVALVATVLSLRNTVTGSIQSAMVRVRPRRAITEPPVFVIGHWRCGTTWLHELLVQDERHTSPTTYECFAPRHFLVSEPVVTRVIGRFLVPIRRPMDTMAVGWHSPQEDEFALMNMGQPSAYARIAFPNAEWRGAEDLLLDLPAAAAEQWKAALRQFLTAVSSRRPKRLILKSPLHMGRIRVLLDMFPDARFVHIVRDPYVVFSSTVHMWQSMYEEHALQKPRLDGLHELVFDTFRELHARFDAARSLIPSGRLLDVRYEDLVRDPVGVVRTIYDRLDLGDIEPALPRVQRHLASVAGHQPNRYVLTAALTDDITRQWGAIIDRQGYAVCPR